MKPVVTAVVVAHDAPEYLEKTLRAIAAQTVSPDRVILVNTGSDVDAQGVDEIRLPQNTKLDVSLREATEQLHDDANGWLWILHDDSAPDEDCLEQMLSVIERSALVGAVAPKQMRWTNPRVIHQLGLTLTPLGTPISLVSGELDQSQHDGESDVLAAGTAGLLVRADIWKKLNGLSSAPPLAADYDLCIRIRLDGHRVVVAPAAKVRHASLSMSGQRSKRWLRGSTKVALRKAALHIRMAYEPIWLVLAYWLFLPLITLGNVFWRLFQKRPDRIASEVAAGVWGFFTIVARLRARAGNASKFRAIRKAFDAPWPRVRAANRTRQEDEDARELGSSVTETQEPNAKSFTAAGGFAWMFVLLGIGFAFFPQGEAAVGGGSIPLGPNWSAVFQQTGVSWQRLGFGFAGPSDPFNWVLLLLSTFVPTAPSSAVVWLLFLAPAIAFLGAWRVAGLLTNRAWVRNFAALTFSLWPVLVQQRAEAQVASLVASITLPWLAFSIARAAGLGRSGSARSMRQTWSWVGLSGLLMAIVGVSSPILAIPILLGLAGVALTRIRRFVYLFWIPLPFAALVTPLFYFLVVGRFEPLAVLADPGLPVATQSPWSLWQPTLSEPLGWAPVILVALALLALLTKRWVVALVIWFFAIANMILASLHWNTQFFEIDSPNQFISGSPNSLLTALALLLVALLSVLLDHSNKWSSRIVGTIVAFAVIVPLGVAATLAPREFDYKDARVVPWLLESAANDKSGSKLLSLSSVGDTVKATLEPVTGIHLENHSLAYRFSVSELNGSDKRFQQLSLLAANLRSANSEGLLSQLNESQVAYILVPNEDLSSSAELISSLDSIPLIESAGLTEFGKLWRVKDAVSVQYQTSSWWSVTKGVQIAVLLGFVLLAIPTGGVRRTKESKTFEDSDGENE
ncbi:MAG: hypothetical protein RLZZ400_80 [Actinomycetota bacterium]